MAPVVVNPDTASNTASTYDRFGGANVNGNAATSDASTQAPVVMKKPSRRRNS